MTRLLADSRVAVTAIVLVAACGAPAAPVTASIAAVPRPTSFPLHDAAGVPAITVLVDGFPIDLLLDSGANAHILVAPAVELVGGVVPTPAAAGRAEGVHAMLGDRSLVAVFSVPALPVLTDRRLAGVVSPWRWAHDGVRIDLVHGALEFGAPPLPGPPTFTGRFVKCDREDFTSPRALADVEIDGHSHLLELDTGSSHTILDTAAARALPAGEPTTVEAALATVPAHAVGNIDARAGSLHRKITLSVLDDRALACAPTEGTLGLDMLSGCILDAAGDTLTAHCGDPVTLPALASAADRIRVVSLDIAPACGVDAAALERAAHPATPWHFHDWGDALAAITADASTADLARASIMVVAACRAAGQPEPAYKLHWRATPAGLVLRYER